MCGRNSLVVCFAMADVDGKDEAAGHARQVRSRADAKQTH
jgi:hypothetical protein